MFGVKLKLLSRMQKDQLVCYVLLCIFSHIVKYHLPAISGAIANGIANALLVHEPSVETWLQKGKSFLISNSNKPYALISQSLGTG
jgi:hypothetical protein